MAQVNFDWVKGLFTTPDEGDVGFEWDIVLDVVNGPVAFSAILIDTFDLEDKEDTLRVERVVGSVWHACFQSGFDFPLTIAERIYVTEVDEDGVPVGLHDLFASVDADRAFLWERRFTYHPVYSDRITDCECSGAPLDFYYQDNISHYDPFFSQIDCRVARRLRDREVLVYTAELKQYAEGAPSASLIFNGWLRVGVKF